MNFNKFGKFIFPTVTTLCTLDVLSSVYNNISSYDISFQESGNLEEEGFPRNIKNLCTSEVKMMSANDILGRSEYMDYITNNEIDFKKYGTSYFPVYDCEGDGALQRKSQEAKDYFEKNFESLQRDYKEYLEKAKKYLFSSNSYIVKNAYQSYIEYDHNLYEKTGRLKVNLDDKFSSFMIKEADNKPFDKLQFYIEPSKKQIDLIDKAQRSKIYRLQVDFKLDSLKDVMRNKGCNNFLREESTCIVTKLVDAKLNIVKVADLEEDDKDMPAYIYEDRHHWELLDSLPIKWE